MIRATMDSVQQHDHRLDYIKGSCVLVMVLYHVMSMAAAYYDVEPTLRRLNFVHASLLFISGWLVGSYYAVKVSDGQAIAVYRRLVVRGLKLCGLFFVLNVAAYTARMGCSFARLCEIDSAEEVLHMFFVQPRGRLMAGEILWEIGLFLSVVAPLVALLPIRYFSGIGVALWIAGFWGQIPFFLCIGTSGILCGWYLRSRDYGKVFQNKFVSAAFLGLWLLYLVFVLLITQVGAMIPGLALVIWIAEIALWFAVFIILFQANILPVLDTYFEFWGNYTLIAYCSQLVLAQVIAKVLHPEDFIVYCCVGVVLNILAMHWALRAIDLARKNSLVIDRAYKFAFA